MNTSPIVAEFVQRYAEFWRKGAQDVHAVYAPDAILCGYEIAQSCDRIASLLRGIYQQGFTDIAIEPVEVVARPNAILMACRYRAQRGEEILSAKSSYVLVESDGIWKIAMHTAT